MLSTVYIVVTNSLLVSLHNISHFRSLVKKYFLSFILIQIEIHLFKKYFISILISLKKKIL